MIEKFYSLHRLVTPQRRRYPWFIGSAMWIGWLLSLLLGKGNMDLSGHLVGTDFVAFYTSGKLLLSGNADNLYNLELARSIQLQIYGEPTFNFNPYLNPPHFALLMVPFALVPYPWAPILWMALGLILLWLSVLWLTDEQPGKTMLLSMTWLPVFYATSFGQNTFLSLAVLCLVYILRGRKNNFMAGMVLSLLFFKPQFMLGVGLLWLLEWRKNWRAIASLGIGILLQIGLSFWLLPKATLDYIHYVQKINANLMLINGFPIWNASSTLAFWLALLPGSKTLTSVLYWISGAIGLVGFLYLWKRQRGQNWLLYSASIAFMIWIIPYIMVYDWALLLIPAILLWKHLPKLQPQMIVLFSLVWITSLLSNSLAYIELKYLHFALQISIPVLGFVFFQLIKLTENREVKESIAGRNP